jgi:hypothetical protein
MPPMQAPCAFVGLVGAELVYSFATVGSVGLAIALPEVTLMEYRVPPSRRTYHVLANRDGEISTTKVTIKSSD